MYGNQNSKESFPKFGEPVFNFAFGGINSVKSSDVGSSNPLQEVPFLAKPKSEIPKFISEVVEETAEIIWELRGVSESTKYMALGNQAKCFLDVGESIGFPIKLCLYMKQNGMHCKVDSWPFGDAHKNDIMLQFELSRGTFSDGSRTPIFVKLGESKLVEPKIDKDGNISGLVRESVLTHPSGAATNPESFWDHVVKAPSSEKLENSKWVRARKLTLKISVTLIVCKEICKGGAKNAIEESIANDLGKLYYCVDNYSDLKLEAKDGAILNAHKFILAARSPYFKRLLEVRKLSEDETYSEKPLKICDASGDTLKTILHWMYTGKLAENISSMSDLVEVAMKFNLADLLKLCDKKLIDNCTLANMFELFQVADKHMLPTAKSNIAKFIQENIQNL